jgi:hypothetical protein
MLCHEEKVELRKEKRMKIFVATVCSVKSFAKPRKGDIYKI